MSATIKSEVDFINAIKTEPKNKEVIEGIGDDTAIIKISSNKYLLFTTDMFVENDHFSLAYSKPEDIGKKVIEANVSDIAAMGGIPKYAVISISLKQNISFDFVKRLYKGVYYSCNKYNVDLVGGDTVHGNEIVINVAMLGYAKTDEICKRKDAKVGDLIMCSGYLGTSTCGLELYRNNIDGFESIKKFHRAPHANLDKSRKVCKYVNAMEDVSDGLASEVRNICLESKKGAIIYWEKIPIREDVRKAAKILGKEPEDFALYGGEDFELVFTVSKKNYEKVKKFGYVVGEVIKGNKIYLSKENKLIEIKKFGYDHFARTKV
ncbi:MAG: thiamine-phosphate kinase [Candidatus Diapherotrites archaeon]|nr:thiamine-phosphate kinase [Candidatus Diapherotrites archaeon]